MPEHHLHALPQGHRIEEYEIVRVLGAGGFGITYLAFDHKLDGPVALKEYFPAGLAGRADERRVVVSSSEHAEVFAWGLDRFIEEARAIHRFRHRNVVRAHRYIEAHGTAYIVMEYVEGDSLAVLLEARGSLSVAAWRQWLDHLLDGLAHVHDQGYLHRDIKPSNIVIRSADGEPVLIDFGSARVSAAERTHTQVLTPEYAPIEQHSRKAKQGPATDIYALAAVSYRVLTGEPPPSAPDRMLDDQHAPLADRVAGSNRAWLAGIDQGLALRPSDRPQSVEAWRATFDRGSATPDPAADAWPVESEHEKRQSDVPTADRRAEQNGKRSLAVAAILAVAAVVVASLIAVVAWFQQPELPDPARFDHPSRSDRVTPRRPARPERVTPTRTPDATARLQQTAPEPVQRPGRNLLDPTSWPDPAPEPAAPRFGSGPYAADDYAQRFRAATGIDPVKEPRRFRQWMRDQGIYRRSFEVPPDPQVTPRSVPEPAQPHGRTFPEPRNGTPAQVNDALEHFTRGSNQDDVLRIQGTPDEIDRYAALGIEVWRYGRSTVDISTSSQQVVEWDNTGSDLNVRLEPGPNTSGTEYFTRGSHQDDVLRIQGTPDEINRYEALGIEVWRYGRSTVDISTSSQQVVEWDNTGSDLNVRLEPGPNTSGTEYFTRGSHQDDVLRIQGTPDEINRYEALGIEVWRYGRSTVDISTSSQQVVEWDNTGRNLNIELSPGMRR